MRRAKVKAEQIRGYWLTDLGQRVEQWVPAGTYDVEAITTGPDNVTVAELRWGDGTGRTYFVPGRILAKLEMVGPP